MNAPLDNSEALLKEAMLDLIQELRRRIKAGEATAADLGVLRQMLKDNNIQATPAPLSPMAGLLADLPFAGSQDASH